jgi:predicted dinucleotide-binding enzyme
MATTSKIAVIGLGNIGKTLAQNFVKGNRPVIIASRKLEDATALANELGSLATASETGEAIKNADIIVLCFGSTLYRNCLNSMALN